MFNASPFPAAFGVTPWVRRLLLANGAVFLLTALSRPFLGGLLVDVLAFHPSNVLLQPWGAVTYMFVHGGVWHILFNMLVLFFFGPPLEERWGGSEFVRFYLIAGLGGAALSFLFAFNASVIGASAAVYGVMLAFAMTWPDSPIYVWGIFPVKAKWLVGFLFVLALVGAGGGGGDGIAHFAHLGGIVAGFLYLRIGGRLQRLNLGIPSSPSRRPGNGGGGGGGLRRGRITQVSVLTRDEVPDPPRRGVGTPEGSGVGSAARMVRPPRAGRDGRTGDENALLDEVDRVLDKISATGIQSLTAAERQLLDEVSKRHRTN